jgi:hypothetical protein
VHACVENHVQYYQHLLHLIQIQAMVATRRSKASHAEIEHHAHEEEPEPVVVENSDSDSDEAPEEVTLTTSRNVRVSMIRRRVF